MMRSSILPESERAVPESVGELIDQLTVSEMQHWHFERMAEDDSLPDTERAQYARELERVDSRRNALAEALGSIWREVLDGSWGTAKDASEIDCEPGGSFKLHILK